MQDFSETAVIATKWQRLEGALIFLSGLALCWHAPGLLPWWGALLLFFLPDLSFVADAFGSRPGAVVYNALHLYGFGAVALMLGLGLAHPTLAALGALWLAHAGFDRMLGYGLKSPQSFTLTHLGRIGRAR